MDHHPRLLPIYLPVVDDIEDVDVKAVADILKPEMSQLSFQDQYHINQDVNGMNILAATEPFELSSIGLEALDKQLRTMDDGHHYYRLAEKLDSELVKSRDFRLKFARAECFDAVKAKNRIEMYLQLIYENFGNEALMRPIKYTDLDKVCDK